MMDSDAYATGADWVLPLLTTGAMVCVAAIPVLQSDSVSRQLLSPPKLQAKRKATYRYRWEKFTTKELLKTLQTMGGDENLVLLVQEEELRDFIVDRCMKGSPKILCVGVDEQLPTREVCVWIWMQDDGIMYQASMKKFGLLLADIMENTMSTTALCFVADASGGLGTKLITNILHECVSSLDVPLVEEPTWLAQFAVLVEDGLIQMSTLEKCLFGMIRLEAHPFKQKTVCVTLPGQAVTAPLLPLLQAAFPCDRHLFVYDGCANVVSRCLLERKLPEEPTMRRFPSAIRHTTPIHRSLTNQIPSLADALQGLPLNFADTTECWMTSVNAMLKLKEEEKTNEYLPFVCKLSLLLTMGTRDERQLALMNVLQFMTGSRTRSLPDGAVQDAERAVATLYADADTHPPKLSIHLLRAVEDCVFRHKSILLGDKTLLDTVLPSKEWTLKAAKKISGCSCCAPEDDDDDDNDNGDTNTTLTAKVLKEINASLPKSTYVDGKTTFAFDPSKFA